MSQRVSTRHIVLVAVRKKAAALAAAALVLLGFGFMLDRATLGLPFRTSAKGDPASNTGDVEVGISPPAGTSSDRRKVGSSPP